mgnify:CR=1 FL=1
MKRIREKLDVYLNNLKIKRKIFLLYFYCVMLPLVLTDTVICGMFIHDEREAREVRLKNMVKSVEYMMNSAADEAAALSERGCEKTRLSFFASLFLLLLCINC